MCSYLKQLLSGKGLKRKGNGIKTLEAKVARAEVDVGPLQEAKSVTELYLSEKT